MKIQTAIDRVSVEKADAMISAFGSHTDIVEVGTSLIKDFGLSGSVKILKQQHPDVCILADIKTCDEGAYEFEKSYEAGADIATVMGFSSMATIRACAEIARRCSRDYMIDLMEVSEEKVRQINEAFPDAILAVHLPSDNQGAGLAELVQRVTGSLRPGTRTAAAGGVTMDTIPILQAAGIEIAIVGSAISKAADIAEAAERFYTAAHAD